MENLKQMGNDINATEVQSVRMSGNSAVLISFKNPEVAMAFKTFMQTLTNQVDDMDVNVNTLSISLIRCGGWVDRVVGIRATHLPTGLFFESTDDRSQHRMQREAIDGLKELLRHA
jgi:hypothetical protein